MEVEIPSLGQGYKIPVHMLVFQRSAKFGHQKSLVLYTFHVNGEFRATRTGVRGLLGNPLNRYAYFSKVEVTFGANDALPPVDEGLVAGKKFLQAVIPILLADHWPDWEAAEQAAAREAEEKE